MMFRESLFLWLQFKSLVVPTELTACGSMCALSIVKSWFLALTLYQNSIQISILFHHLPPTPANPSSC